MFHAGHAEFLRRCRTLGHVLIVGLNTDDSVRRLKGPSRPINSLEDRRTVLAACRWVDEVIEFDEATPCELIRNLRPDIIVKGPGYSAANMPEAAVVAEWGGRVVILDGPPISTTDIIARLEKTRPTSAVAQTPATDTDKPPESCRHDLHPHAARTPVATPANPAAIPQTSGSPLHNLL